MVRIAGALTLALSLVLPAATSAAVPPDRVLAFGSLQHGWVSGIPRDVRTMSRIVGVFTGHRLAVAPTRNGNFCEAFSRSFAGCRARPGFEGRQLPLVGLTTMGDSRHGITALAGDVVATPDHQLYLVFRDGTTVRVPLTYVTAPIGAGFFWVPVSTRRAPARLELRTGATIVETVQVRPLRPPPHP